MGVIGLTTYIARHTNSLLEPHELHDCTLVIDGNSVASMLYSHSKCVSAFGGDYDKYANCVASFFLALQKCNITPIVLLDGGNASRKLYTVMQRLKEKIRRAKNVTAASRKEFFPLLMKEVFKDVLLNLKIKFAQCFFEADDEIAAVARSLRCHVLSYDSDFYVYDVLYIPFPTLSLQTEKMKDVPQYYMSCRVYKVDNFLNQFGGLSKPLLPLLATLLGNDYIRPGIFKNFFASLKEDKSRSTSNTQKKIAALLSWLQDESFETALEKVLLTVKKPYRCHVRRKITANASSYVECSSDVLPYLCLPSPVETDIEETGNMADDSMTVMPDDVEDEDDSEKSDDGDASEKSDDGDDNTVDDSDNEESEDEGDLSDEDIATDSSSLPKQVETLPDWFKDTYSKGTLPGYFIDMVSRNTYFCPPQVEDYGLPFSHTISLNIISAIYGLIKEQETVEPLTFYSRNAYLSPEKQTLKPAGTSPSLSVLGSLTLDDRVSILFETAGMAEEEQRILREFPDEWRLFIVALVVWIRDCKHPAVSDSHLHSILLCVVALYVIDSKIGYLRAKAALTRARNNISKKQSKSAVSHEGLVSSPLTHSLNAVTQADCIYVAEALLAFHSIDGRLRGNPKLYSVTTVHAFAQFQSILFHLIHLNALLKFPLLQCRPARFFSGTFVNNVYNNLKRRADVSSYMELILSCGSSVRAMYKVLVASIVQLVPQLNVVRRKKRTHKKFAKAAKKEVNVICVNEQATREEALYVDKQNKFSALGLCDD